MVARTKTALGATLVFLTLVTACAVEEVNQPKLRPNAPVADAAPAQDTGTQPPPTTNTPADAGIDTAPIEVFLSDMTLDVVSNGYGPLEKNMSCGEINENDGKPLTVGGKVYAKGLGAHAASEINVALNGNYTIFIAEVGVDDEVGEELGSVVFQVIADGETIYDSGVVTGADTAKMVSVNVAGKQQLKLVVTDGANDTAYDHAGWGGARLRQK